MNTLHQRLSLLALLLTITACAHYPVNPGVEDASNFTEKGHFKKQGRSDELMMILAFSGGGTRAAALSYGVLEALADVEIPMPQTPGQDTGVRPSRLLDEVDRITSVSGGSFTAAYYGLHGDRIFEDFEDRFLNHNVERGLFLKILAPHNFLATFSPNFGRSDLAAEYYDRLLFDGKTLGDIWNRSGPRIDIQATDIINGYHFGFVPYLFALTCNDFDGFPVSRAVTASSAFPGPFTPIVLKNYAGTCGVEPEPWIARILAEKKTASRTYGVAQRLNSYVADPVEKPYIHLMDGGIADNLGLRNALGLLQARGADTFRDIGLENTRHAVFLVVNAATKTIQKWSALGEIPGLGGIIGATSSVMVDVVVYDTLYLLNRMTAEWKAEYAQRFPSRPPINVYIVLVEFAALEDKEERLHFQNMPTSLSLPKKSVDELRGVAKKILYQSKPFQELVENLGGTIDGAIENRNRQ